MHEKLTYMLFISSSFSKIHGICCPAFEMTFLATSPLERFRHSRQRIGHNALVSEHCGTLNLRSPHSCLLPSCESGADFTPSFICASCELIRKCKYWENRKGSKKNVRKCKLSELNVSLGHIRTNLLNCVMSFNKIERKKLAQLAQIRARLSRSRDGGHVSASFSC